MTAYGTEIFFLNDVNLLRNLLDIIARHLPMRLTDTSHESSDGSCRQLLESYSDMDRFLLFTVVVTSRATDARPRWTCALRIIRERYTDFGPAWACVKLDKINGLLEADNTGWFMDAPQVTAAACTSAVSARRTHPY